MLFVCFKCIRQLVDKILAVVQAGIISCSVPRHTAAIVLMGVNCIPVEWDQPYRRKYFRIFFSSTPGFVLTLGIDVQSLIVKDV